MQTDVVKTRRAVGLAHPVHDALVVLERPGAHPAGKHDHVGRRQLLEGGVDREAEHPVLAPHLAAFVADEGDVEVRDALEHLVGSDGVERRELREQRDGDLQAVGHAEFLSLGSAELVRKRRR